MAECMRGNGDQAYEYYRAYMPSAYNTRAELREIEPTCTARRRTRAVSPNAGKSRVPWLTGTASWSLFVAVQHILGIVPEVDGLRIDPCIPRHWPGFEMQRVVSRQEAEHSGREPLVARAAACASCGGRQARSRATSCRCPRCATASSSK